MAEERQLSRNNHYLSRLYLKNWEAKDGIHVYRLLVSDENVPLWSSSPIARTASLKNLYVRMEDGEEKDDFEHFFDKEYESPAKAPLSKVIKGERISEDEWYTLIEYVGAQYVRTPAFQQWTYKRMQQIIPEQLDEIGEKMKSKDFYNHKHDNSEIDYSLLPVSIKISDEKTEPDQTNVLISTVNGKSWWLFAIKNTLRRHSPYKKMIHKLKWSIVTMPDEVDLPTCDNPFVIARRLNNGNYELTDGLGGRDRLIVFPLSPKIALIATHKREFWNKQASIEFALTLKRLIVKNALLYVYSNADDKCVVDLRERTVDRELFRQIEQGYSEMYDQYKETEAPLLRKR